MKPFQKKLLLLACAAATASAMTVTAFAQSSGANDIQKVTFTVQNPSGRFFMTNSGFNCNTPLWEILQENFQNHHWNCGWVSCPGSNWQPGCPGGDEILPPENKPEIPDIPEVPEVPESPENPDTPQQPDDGDTLSAYASKVAQLVNEERQKAGLSPLTVDVKVQSAAQVRAKEQETLFSHTRPDGSKFSTALTQAGVSFQSAGENIAYGQTSPEQVMQSWMNSSGHRANILNSQYTTLGVGCYQGANGTLYWTQLFVR